MLENEGGTAGAVEMEVGGKLGKWLILRVHKSPATGAVVSATVYAPDTEHWGKKVDRQRINIQRFAAGIYTPPTDESRAEAARLNGEATERKKAKNATAPKLINPTKEAADELQAHINQRAKRYSTTDPENTVLEITQGVYSANSGGSYSKFDTYYVRAGGIIDRTDRNMYSGKIDKLPVVCKVRLCSKGYGYRVVVLTNKPQSALPDWKTIPETADAREAAALQGVTA